MDVKKNILLVGASGFLGTHILNKLRSQNYNVETLSRLEISTWDEMSQPIKEKIELAFYDVVINAAGYAQSKVKNNPAEKLKHYNSNFCLTKKLVVSCVKNEKTIFILLSTANILSSNGNSIEANDALEKNNFYEWSKILAETFVTSSFSENNKRYYIIRPTLIYGNGVKGNFRFLEKCVKYIKIFPIFTSIAKMQKNYVHVENILSLISYIIAGKIRQKILNVSDMENYFLEDIILGIAKKYNTKCVYINIPKFVVKFLQRVCGTRFDMNNNNKQHFLPKELLYDFNGVSKVFSLTDYIEGKDL